MDDSYFPQTPPGQPWMRLQTTHQRAASFRAVGADVMRPQIDSARGPRSRRMIPSPRTHVLGAVPPPTSFDHLDSPRAQISLPKIDLDARKDSPRPRTSDPASCSFDQFRSGVVALEVKIKEAVQHRLSNDGPTRPPSKEFLHMLCESLYECSLVVSPIQQTLLALVPEVIRSIYNTRSSVGQQIDMQKLNQYTPFLLQVDLLDAERQELISRVDSLEGQLDSLVHESMEYKRQTSILLDDLQSKLATKNLEIKHNEDAIEALQQHNISVTTEADRFKSLYRNTLDHYEEDLAAAVSQEVEKYNTRLVEMEKEKKSAVLKMNLLREDIETMKQQMDSMVPYQTYDEAKRHISLLKFELVIMKEQMENLRKTQSNLVSKAIRELKKRERKCDVNKQAYTEELGRRTPRPDWQTIFPDYDTAIEFKSIDLTTEGSTAGKVMLLKEELIRVNEELEQYKSISTVHLEKEKEVVEAPTGDKFFTGLGLGPEVPKYLRIAGKIKNRKLSKRDTEMIIKDVWRERSQALKGGGNKKIRLPDFLYQYLQNHYGLHNVVVEWAYNLIDALERFKYDGDCELFLRTLQGELSDDVHDDQMTMVENLRQIYIKQDITANGKESGKLPRKDVLSLLGKFFTLKTPERLNLIRGSLLHDQPGATILYQKLFEEDRDGNQGMFVETIRSQHLEEILEFNDSIEAALAKLAEENPSPKTSDLIRMMSEIDPHKPPADIKAWIATVLALPTNPEDGDTIDALSLKKGFRPHLFKRTSFPKTHQEMKKREIAKLLEKSTAPVTTGENTVRPVTPCGGNRLDFDSSAYDPSLVDHIFDDILNTKEAA